MWDLYQIIAENNRMAMQQMMNGIRLERVKSTIPDSWPLHELCRKMQIGPPLLRELISGFIDIDSLERFRGIIRQFLPEYEEEILSQRRPERQAKFCQLFSKKYYPLPFWAPNVGFDEFSRGLPVETLAMSHSQWHEMDMRPGYLMLLSLVVYPYEGDIRDEEGWGYGIWDEDNERPPFDQTLAGIFTGTRVALISAVQNIVGEIAKKIPPSGWTADELHVMTDDTSYDGVGDFAAWALSETGCAVLDSAYDDFEYMEGYGEPLFRWSNYNVNMLTEQWPKVVKIREKIDHIVEWIEIEPRRFTELLEFLLAEAPKKLKAGNKKGKRSYDPTEHWSPLEHYGMEEEEDYYDEESTVGEYIQRVSGGAGY